MSGCDISSFGGEYESKLNKTSQKIDVSMLGGVHSYNIKNKKGKLLKSRDFKVGDHARIVRELPHPKEIDEKKLGDLDELPHAEILGFWTVIDGPSCTADGAELQFDGYRRRLPLRTLLPMANPKPKPTRDPEEL